MIGSFPYTNIFDNRFASLCGKAAKNPGNLPKFADISPTILNLAEVSIFVKWLFSGLSGTIRNKNSGPKDPLFTIIQKYRMEATTLPKIWTSSTMMGS